MDERHCELVHIYKPMGVFYYRETPDKENAGLPQSGMNGNVTTSFDDVAHPILMPKKKTPGEARGLRRSSWLGLNADVDGFATSTSGDRP
jgi:hypothetical protein